MLARDEFLAALRNPELDIFAVVRMARIDAAGGAMHTCIARLKVDADKLRAFDKRLYETVTSTAPDSTPWG